mgnify:CR=1 FL=1
MEPDAARERSWLSSTMYPFSAAGAGVWRISSSAAVATSGAPSASDAAAPRPTTADASLGRRRAFEGDAVAVSL